MDDAKGLKLNGQKVCIAFRLNLSQNYSPYVITR